MKKKEYRYYQEGVWFISRKFPFLHTSVQTVYIDPVPCDMNPKSKYYSSINPEKQILKKIDKMKVRVIMQNVARRLARKDQA